MAEKQEVDKGMQIGDGLFVRIIRGSALKEQDINAQQMEPTKFERLVENIRQRGSLESLPYCHQPDGVGPIAIVSGHHRARAARAAGLQEFAVLVDTNAMPMSLIRAKQIAHNELTGRPDEEILRQMIEQIDSVDDLLVSGLPEDYLPAPERSATTLDLPHAEFDWKMVTLMFLPAQLDRLDELVSSVQSQTDVVGVARQDQFVEFSKALVQYGQVMDIKNMAAVIDKLTQVALREMSDLAIDDQDDPDDD